MSSETGTNTGTGTTQEAVLTPEEIARDLEQRSRYLIDLVKAGAADFVERQIKFANVNFRDERGMTALHHAAAIGARPCIRLLVNCGRCDYLIKDNQDRYAFELAIEWAKDYAVGRLLAKNSASKPSETTNQHGQKHRKAFDFSNVGNLGEFS